ncbi:MAG: hypothetical protein GEV11_26785 [Streptosporangiales bacterium]|nr:hypothetical protein [Streptosporangiales bacterium]
MPYRFAIAPSGFKESLSALEAAQAIAEGLLRVTAELLVACNPYNVLCGPRGVARGRDAAGGGDAGAGAKPGRETAAGRGIDLRYAPGTGASGGLGAGLAPLGAVLRPRFEVLLGHLDLDARLAAADLVVTAEGALDEQTPRGKVPGEVSARARRLGRPVVVLAGTLGAGAREINAAGFDAYSGILPAPVELAEALLRGREFLVDAAERALMVVLVGTRLERA